MAATNTLKGGAFQDADSNPLSNGFLTMKAGNQAFCVWLDVTGNVTDSPLISIGVYTVTAHNADGEIVWGPHYVPVLDTPSPFNIGAWLSQ
jgi:hypothetical protein